MKIKKPLLVLSLLISLNTVAHADLINNGSFENGTFTGGSYGFPLAQQVLPGDSSTLPGWTTNTSEIAWFQSGQAGITTVAGNYALDLTGFCDGGSGCPSGGLYGGISQSISTVIGTTYQLDFLGGTYSLNSSAPTLVATAGSNVESFTLTTTSVTSGIWQSYSFEFVATSSNTEIAFSGSGGAVGQTFYLGLDNISVNSVSAVPLPTPIWLFGSALIGFLGLNRRKTIQP
jgi:hypothetical protein